METPRPALMDLYGTDVYFIRKQAAFANADQVLRGIASLGFVAEMANERKNDEELHEQAEAMNEAAEEAEAMRMQQVVNGFKGAEMDPRLVKVAEDIGRRLARQELDKEAGRIGNVLNSALGGAGRAASGLGSRLSQGFGPNARMAAALGEEGANAFRPSLAQRAGGAISGAGQKMQGMAASGAVASGLKGLAPAAASAVPAAEAAAAKSKPLISGLTKAKIGIGALGLGTAYLGYKALKGVKDYMMEPSYPSIYGAHGPRPFTNVNEYGYPSY